MSRKLVIWRSVALASAATLLAAEVLMFADYSFKGGVDFLDEHFNVFVIAALAGMIVCSVGLIGWGISATRSACTGIGFVAFLAPITVSILGGSIGGTNVHGPFYLLFFPMLIVSFFGLVLLLTSAFRKQSTHT